MPQDLPPLSPLLAFEAAAKTGSFKQAAQRLCLTPSAVSQQIKTLEDAIGAELFDRSPGAVKLSAAGHAYAQTVAQALDTLRRGTRTLRQNGKRKPLRLTVDPFLAQELVIPLMPKFNACYPDFELVVESEGAVIDLRGASADAALRCGRGPWSGLSADVMSHTEVRLIAAPSLLARQPIETVQDLSKHALIHIQGTGSEHWREAAQIYGFEIKHRLTFNSFQETIHAAVHGMGVAFGLFPVLNHFLSADKLRIPLPLRWDGHTFSLVYRPEDAELAGIAALRTALRAAFAAYIGDRTAPQGHPASLTVP